MKVFEYIHTDNIEVAVDIRKNLYTMPPKEFDEYIYQLDSEMFDGLIDYYQISPCYTHDNELSVTVDVFM